MTEANPDLAILRRRLVLMGAVVAVCAVAALASVFAELQFRQAWGRWTFLLALLIGFAAQGWVIYTFVKQGRGPK